MKNTFTKFAGVAVVALALVQTIQAAPIVGNIGFTGRAVVDSANISSATQVTSWINPAVNGTTGSFTSVANGTAVIFNSPWNFNSPTGLNPFWVVGGFTFQLLSSSITYQGATAVVVDGTGLVNGNDYDQTALSWNFTITSAPVGPQTFTFSTSSAAVPDGGATVALLGIALSGVGLLRKKLTA